jgi:hypothetical protein
MAYVIMIGERFYYMHSPKRVSTAAYLAGAKIFQSEYTKPIEDVEKILVEKRIKFQRKTLVLHS